jgi:HTH-type transcriptional regulator/antitoxin HigA
MASQSTWRQTWAVPPGEILSEELEARGLSQSELARRMGRPVKTINEIVNAKAALTADTALQLELAIGISANLWMGLEANYRQQLAVQRALVEMEEHVDWAKHFPIGHLRRYELIDPDAGAGASLVASLLSFFGVSNVSAWEGQWQSPQAAFRRSQAFAASPHATAAWLRWGEIQAASASADPFDANRLVDVLSAIGPLSREEPFSDVVDELRECLATCGVVLVLTPEIPGTRASGAARWVTRDRALIQLSLRHKSDDQFWFSLFHEAAHLLDDRGGDHLDDADGAPNDEDVERRVDQRARDLLVEPGAYADFVATGQFGAARVRDFAAGQSISPGIVVGRLQREGHLARNQLNALKKRIRWA